MSNVATLSAAVPRPAHVPESLMYDFDMHRDPAYVADPHQRIMDLIRNAPLTGKARQPFVEKWAGRFRVRKSSRTDPKLDYLKKRYGLEDQ